MSASKLFRFVLTTLLLGAALWFGKGAWDQYMESAWTRDGRIKADVVNITADVAGAVTEVHVRDNQFVRKGDVLFVVDPARYQSALEQARSLLAAQQVEKGRRTREAKRRAVLDDAVVSAESREGATSAMDGASAQVRAATEAVHLATLNLERTVVRAPVSGYVTNLNVHVGDFAAVGVARLAVIDSDSFYVAGYFEETKLPLLKAGAPVQVKLMGGDATLHGHIESIARGITDRDASTGRELLADVNPTFSWVRLAQRVPVRIHIDQQPKELTLVAGTTCTVIIDSKATAAAHTNGEKGPVAGTKSATAGEGKTMPPGRNA
ncbi:efflux RND transporter periplasmic adaptor subunit [Massilia sp. MB5]|uniref:efflux RND transporter periplasmic adaptor subunit n=1 Tax=Massilia sp. MB5 TaxID=2919578 RepID=UPI001F0D2111|nr:efflux RND transporter periplasmic adaptor subunit [Massilia sp. MB5]UMR33193.1 efflux RND transporter periplasmic adaptor subunit [Massilia sp. MB5]